MTRRTIAAAFISIAATRIVTPAAQAGDIVLSTMSYDSIDSYDYSMSNSPPPGATTIGSFSPFTIPTGDYVTGITINGTFGNGDSDVTALSDYYLGDALDGETAVPVAGCDDPTNSCSDDSGNPTGWNYTLTRLQIGELAHGLADGSLDFTYTWDSSPPVVPTPGFPQTVYAGPVTIDISYALAPEPATVLFCFSGIAGIFALRRFRKA
jgi:hypothetical protein